MTALHIAQSGTFLGISPFLVTLHDHRVIAKLLHDCFALRSMLLEGGIGVPQHLPLHNLLRCLFVYMFHRLLVKWLVVE